MLNLRFLLRSIVFEIFEISQLRTTYSDYKVINANILDLIKIRQLHIVILSLHRLGSNKGTVYGMVVITEHMNNVIKFWTITYN